MLRCIVLLVLPLFCDGQIKDIMMNIDINVDSNHKSVSVNCSNDKRTVTDYDVTLFNITEDNLMRGLRIELGKAPNNVFLKDPTIYYDLFSKFHWQPVTRIIRIDKIDTVGITNEPILLTTHLTINNTTKPVKHKISAFTNVEYAAASEWSEYGYMQNNTVYKLGFNFTGPAASFNFQRKWRDKAVKSTMVRFGTTNPGYMIVKPNETVVLRLYCLKTIMLFEIHYLAELGGRVIADYDPLYGKYHFYAPAVTKIMKAAGLSNGVRTTEVVELRFYSEPKLEVEAKEINGTVEVVTPFNPFARRTKNLNKRVKHFAEV